MEWDLQRVRLGILFQQSINRVGLQQREDRARIDSLLVSDRKLPGGVAVGVIAQNVKTFITGPKKPIKTEDVPSFHVIFEIYESIVYGDDYDIGQIPDYMNDVFLWKRMAYHCFTLPEFDNRDSWIYAYYYYIVLSRFILFFREFIRLEDQIEDIKRFKLTPDSDFGDFKRLVNEESVDYINDPPLDSVMLGRLFRPFVRSFITLVIESENNKFTSDDFTDFLARSDTVTVSSMRSRRRQRNTLRVPPINYLNFLKCLIEAPGDDVDFGGFSLFQYDTCSTSESIIYSLHFFKSIDFVNLILYTYTMIGTLIWPGGGPKWLSFGHLITKEGITFPDDEEIGIWPKLFGTQEPKRLHLDLKSGECTMTP